MKTQTYTILTLSFMLLLGIPACDDAFLDRQPPSSLTEDIFYQTEADAISAVNVAYSSLQLTGMYS